MPPGYKKAQNSERKKNTFFIKYGGTMYCPENSYGATLNPPPPFATAWLSRLISISTVCPRSLDPIYAVTYHTKWENTSWTYSIILAMQRLFSSTFAELLNYSTL